MATVLESVGKRTLNDLDYVGSLNIQLWATLRAMRMALPFVGNRYRWQATVRQMLQIGVDALPMVSLMAICTGFILAMQGASELRRFGAVHYVIDLVAVGFTRELGPLLTAIAVSGRSGSAFAAEIGTMKVTEEIDALRVMAFEPIAKGQAIVYKRVHMVLGEGNFVLVVAEATFGGVSTAIYDLFRIANGRIAEHWDKLESIP